MWKRIWGELWDMEYTYVTKLVMSGAGQRASSRIQCQRDTRA